MSILEGNKEFRRLGGGVTCWKKAVGVLCFLYVPVVDETCSTVLRTVSMWDWGCRRLIPVGNRCLRVFKIQICLIE